MTNLTRTNFQAHPFHLVSPSPWPLFTCFSLLSLTTCFVLSVHGFAYAQYFFDIAFITLVSSMCFWFRDVIAEATYLGNHTLAVQRGLNIGVVLFIVSEALFFLTIFWTFFHSALSPTAEQGAHWPPAGIDAVNSFELPLLNTIILLSSGLASHIDLVSVSPMLILDQLKGLQILTCFNIDLIKIPTKLICFDKDLIANIVTILTCFDRDLIAKISIVIFALSILQMCNARNQEISSRQRAISRSARAKLSRQENYNANTRHRRTIYSKQWDILDKLTREEISYLTDLVINNPNGIYSINPGHVLTILDHSFFPPKHVTPTRQFVNYISSIR